MSAVEKRRPARSLALVDDDAWWRRAAIYQIYPRSFNDSDGDGIGDIGGIIERLDYLARLGVDAVWLSPVYESPQVDNGYDISDYRTIDPVYGTFDTFDQLVEAAKQRGIRIIMDLVVNHTSDQHEWFRESASSVDSARRDWYWWRPPRLGTVAGESGAEPTNWGSFFTGPTWSLEPVTGQYYLHLFAREQPDLNWERPAVRHAVYDMMRWWLDRGIDGFRMDVINLISKDPDLPDGIVPAGKRHGDGFPHYSNGPRLHEFLAEMRTEVFASRSGVPIAIGEMPGVTLETAQRATDPCRGELDMVFQFDHVETDHAPGNKWSRTAPDCAALIDSLCRWQEGLADVGWNSLYLGNHDQPRSLSRFGSPERYWYRSATALATMIHMMSGTPFVYQGDELGMVNAEFESLDALRDVESLNHYRALTDAGESPGNAWREVIGASRDHARTPMPWTDGESGGFSAGTPWIDPHPPAPGRSADHQIDDPGSVFSWYRKLIELRHVDPIVALGRFRRLTPSATSLLAFGRLLDDEMMLVVVNLSDESGTLEPNLLEEKVVYAMSLVMSNLPQPPCFPVGTIEPWEASIWRTPNT